MFAKKGQTASTMRQHRSHSLWWISNGCCMRTHGLKLKSLSAKIIYTIGAIRYNSQATGDM